MLKKIALLLIASFALTGQAQAMGEDPAGYTETKHPIVLVHGMLGFDSAVGIDYWYDIVDNLRNDGATVYVVNVQATNSIAVRGEQLIDSLERYRSRYGHTSFNLIGHSYGSHTSRYAAAVRPELVTSVTSVGGANKGNELPGSDGHSGQDEDNSFTDNIFNALAFLIDATSGQGDATNQDFSETVRQLSNAGMAEWNKNFPQGVPVSACGEGDYQVNGIRYYSWSGVAQRTSLLDPLDVYIDMRSGNFGDNTDHDGLVPRCSSHLGKVIRDDYYLNHLDEINQTLGLKSHKSPDPVQIFRNHANRLKNAGL